MTLTVPIELLLAILSTVPYWPLLVVCNVPVYDDDPVIRITVDKFMRYGWRPFLNRDRLIPDLLTLFNVWLKLQRGWLFVNMVLHAGVAVLVYHIVGLALPSIPAAVAVLAMAWHPAGVMAVTQNILGRPSMLCAGFAFATLLLGLGPYPWLALLPITLTVLTKQESWALPGLLLLVWIAF